MVTLEDVQAQVSARYALLGMPSWPNPHPVMPTTRPEEYSRVTAPERYRIVHARARVWAAVLGALPGVTAEPMAPAPFEAEGGRALRFDRGTRLTSSRPGTLSLLLLERDAPTAGGEGVIAVLHLGVVRPEVSLAEVPDCGCDACDQGSEDLLRAIDEAVHRVVAGPLVALRGRRWFATWYPDGGCASGQEPGPGGFRRTMDLCRRIADGEKVPLPRDTEVLVGHAWLDAAATAC